jgi:sodium-dependent dicarboxylate transporter 2/3/5
MIKTGVLLNVISIEIVALYIYYVLPLVWGIDLHSFPSTLK